MNISGTNIDPRINTSCYRPTAPFLSFPSSEYTVGMLHFGASDTLKSKVTDELESYPSNISLINRKTFVAVS